MTTYTELSRLAEEKIERASREEPDGDAAIKGLVEAVCELLGGPTGTYCVRLQDARALVEGLGHPVDEQPEICKDVRAGITTSTDRKGRATGALTLALAPRSERGEFQYFVQANVAAVGNRLTLEHESQSATMSNPKALAMQFVAWAEDELRG